MYPDPVATYARQRVDCRGGDVLWARVTARWLLLRIMEAMSMS